MKKIRHGSIMSLIYAVLIAIPMVSIVSRVIYVQSNKNAFQNYSGKNEIIEYVNADIVELGEDYRFKPTEYTIDHNLTLEFVNNGSYANSNLIADIENTNKIILRSDGTIVFYQDGTWLNETYYSNFMFYIDLELTAYYPNSNADYSVLKDLLFVPSSNNNYLDSAFDYSLSQYVTDNSFGNLNLFEWWSNLFLDLSQSKNALYIHFINWYMN